MSLETKTLEIRGTPYVIKRFSFGEVIKMSEIVSVADSEVYQVFVGTVSPKFESLDAVKTADHEVVLTLFTEIQEFNKVDTAFLSRLKKLSSQALPRTAMPQALKQ